MSSSKFMLWAARALTVLMFTTLSAITGGIPAAQAAIEAPPPVQYDRPCGVHDEYFIPLGGGVTYYVDGVYQTPGYHVAASSVTIYAEAGFTGGPWTFNYTSGDACPSEAVNTMTVNVGLCKPASGLTDVTGTYKNEPDASTFPQENVFMTTRFVVKDVNDYIIDNTVGRLSDGESVSLGLGTSGDGTLQGTGLEPGTYELQGWYQASASRVTLRFFVPSCGSKIPPAGDPSGLGPSIVVLPPPNVSSAQATGRLKLLRRVDLLKVTAINRKVSGRTTFRLKRPGTNKPLTIVAEADRVVVKRVKAMRPGKYVLRALVKVDGQLRYKPVAQLVVRR